MENTQGTEKRKRGRPPKPVDEVKRHNVTIAMADPVRRAIGEAAERNGRSISSEIDFRLGMSLELDKDTGDPAVRRLIDFVRLAALRLQDEAGKGWTEDADLATALIGAFMGYVRGNSPRPPEDDTDDEIEASMAQLRKRDEDWQDMMKRRHMTPEETAQVQEDLLRTLDYAAKRIGLDNIRARKRAKGLAATEDLAQLFQLKAREGKPPLGHD